jgi:hypothetical protein
MNYFATEGELPHVIHAENVKRTFHALQPLRAVSDFTAALRPTIERLSKRFFITERSTKRAV